MVVHVLPLSRFGALAAVHPWWKNGYWTMGENKFDSLRVILVFWFRAACRFAAAVCIAYVSMSDHLARVQCTCNTLPIPPYTPASRQLPSGAGSCPFWTQGCGTELRSWWHWNIWGSGPFPIPPYTPASWQLPSGAVSCFFWTQGRWKGLRSWRH